MDYSITFARHFSRLVWLLLHESGNIDEQKAALRAVVTVSKDGPITLDTRDWRLVVNGTPLPEALTGVQDLCAQLIGHAVVQLIVDQKAAPADLLGVARILAAEPVPGDGGVVVQGKLQALGARTVHVVVRPPDSVGAPTASPVPADALPPPPPPVPPSTNGHEPRTAPRPAPRSAARPAPRAEPVTAAMSAPRTEPHTEPRTAPVRGIITEESPSGTYLAFAAVRAPKGSAADLIGQLDATHSANVATRLLDELVVLAENASREGKYEVVAEAFHGVVSREEQVLDPDIKRAFVMAMRRMTKPTLLRAVAMLLPRNRERLDDLMLVLMRTGEDGADALIEQLTAAQSLSDRRVFFDALVKLNAGVPALIHMLGDARWYVVRNAADLLGEMTATEADVPLAELLKHDDDRVRRAATTALAKLGTPRSVQAMREALKDTSAQVRMQAAAGIASRKGAKSAATLGRALDAETDGEVQMAIVAALGRLATPDAVQKLIRVAEADGRLFRRKSVPLRVAAVNALGEARTPAAVAALQSLLDDREREVKDAVFRVVMQSSRTA